MTENKDDGGPAFPIPEQQFSDGVMIISKQGADGMSLRDWFAGMALQGLLACPLTRDTPEAYAKSCYERADAMLAERAKR